MAIQPPPEISIQAVQRKPFAHQREQTTTLCIANKNIPSRARGQLFCFGYEQRKSIIPETTDLSNPSSSIVLRTEQNR